MARSLACFLILTIVSLPSLAQTPPARVQLADVRYGPLFEDVLMQGSVVGGQVAMLSTSVSGLIEQAPPRPGTTVDEGAPLLRLDSELAALRRQQTDAAREQAEATLADAERLQREGNKLAERGDLARSVQDSRINAVRQAQALLAQRRAEQRLAEEQLRRHEVTAPFTGTVAQRFSAAGEWVNPGDPLLALVNDQDLWLEFSLPQRYFGQLPMGAEVRVTLAGREEQKLEGRVAGIIPFSDGAARQLRLRVELADWPAVAPGSSAQGRLRLESEKRALLVPRDGINRYPDGRTTVWLAERREGQLLAREQRVQLRGEFDDTVAIQGSLQAGSRVVIRGNEGLTADRALTVVEATTTVTSTTSDGFFDAIVRHGTLVAVVCLIVTVVGIAASMRIPVQMIPDLDVRTISVETRWPGATPQDVEQEILLEQEEFLRTVPSLSRMTSTASSGAASVELEFPFDVDITETLIRVNNALSRVPSYPENVDQPRIVATSFSSNAFMYFRVAPLPDNPRQLDMTLMQDFLADNVRPRMESVSGVSEVSVGGGAERQMQLLLDPAAMAALNVSVSDLRSALNARNRDISGGELEAGKRRYLMRTVGRFRDLDSLRNMVIRRDGDQLVRLADVAEVRQDHFKLRSLSFSNGNPILSMSVRREPGSNVISIKRAMLAEVAAINREVLEPAGMRMSLTSDDAKYVEASIANVWTNLGIGAVFASLVLFAFLRSGKATLVGIVGIPLCTIAAFLGLLLAGRTLNVISLAGIAFAIGMTIDNAIVVLESIERQRRRGLERVQAAVTGVRQVWPAVLASTLTTVMVFLPVTLIEQEAGQLYSDIAIAVSAAILMSMLTAITLVPTLSAHMDFNGAAEGDDVVRGSWLGRVLAAIAWLNAAAHRRLAVIAATVMTSVLVITLLTPPAEYLPEGEEAKTFASMTAPPGYNLDTMATIAQDLEQELLAHVQAPRAAFESGETDIPPMQYFNLSVDPGGLRVISETVDPDDIEALMDALTARYEAVPGMRGFAARGSIISSNDGGTRSISLDVAGPDLATIYQVGDRIYQRAEALFGNPRIQTRPGSLTLDQPLIEIHPHWDRAAELGIDAAQLGRAVAALTDGAYLDEFYLSDRKIDIYAYGPQGPGAALSELPEVQLRGDNDERVALSDIAELRETVATNSIRRIDGRRTVTLNIIPPRDVALETGVNRVRNELLAEMQAAGEIPGSVNISLSGASDQLAATREALVGNFLIALLIVYLLLVAIFTHWGYPLLIMTAIPLGVAGGIVGLALMNTVGALLPWLGLGAIYQPFDMISMLGFLILMGTVVNNPILVVHQALDNLRDGTGIEAAVNAAVESRLRPIAMATLTTVCGLSPLVLIPGEGTELYRGVGAIVLFGLMGAALVTLFFLPPATVTALKLSRRVRGY